jgi:hypothetical protein
MDVDNEKKRLSQEKQLESFSREPKPTEMLIVSRSSYSKNTCYDIHPALIPLEQKDETLESYSRDLSHESGIPLSYVYFENGEEKIRYFRFGSDNGIEPLVICRDFHNVRDGYQEVSEEFRLFHNLYHDYKNNRHIKISDDGNETTVIEESDDCVKIRLKELKQFLTVKDMCISHYLLMILVEKRVVKTIDMIFVCGLYAIVIVMAWSVRIRLFHSFWERN